MKKRKLPGIIERLDDMDISLSALNTEANEHNDALIGLIRRVKAMEALHAKPKPEAAPIILEPCPCGAGRPEIVSGGTLFLCRCIGCDKSSDAVLSKADAGRAWNAMVERERAKAEKPATPDAKPAHPDARRCSTCAHVGVKYGTEPCTKECFGVLGQPRWMPTPPPEQKCPGCAERDATISRLEKLKMSLTQTPHICKGCEAKISKISGLKAELSTERAKSAKLVAALKDIDKAIRDNGCTPCNHIRRTSAKAIREYENAADGAGKGV